MLRMLYSICICLLVSIPHTSIQDEQVTQPSGRQASRRVLPPNNKDSIASLIQWLTERQHHYETASYALSVNNIFPNFAKFFHERGEQKYNDVKGLIDLCQVLDIDLNFKFISSAAVNEPLRFLSPGNISQTNIAEFFSRLEKYECETIYTRLSGVYNAKLNMSVPLQMYLKDKLYMKQILTCKITTDINKKIDRFVDKTSTDSSIPFSLMYLDSHSKVLLKK